MTYKTIEIDKVQAIHASIKAKMRKAGEHREHFVSVDCDQLFFLMAQFELQQVELDKLGRAVLHYYTDGGKYERA